MKGKYYYMGQCVKCRGFYYPELMVYADKKKKDQMCLFCKTEKQAVEFGVGDRKCQITKEQAQKDYKIFLKQLAEKPTIKNLKEMSDQALIISK